MTVTSSSPPYQKVQGSPTVWMDKVKRKWSGWLLIALVGGYVTILVIAPIAALVIGALAGCRRERFLGAKRRFWLMRVHQSYGFRWLFSDFWPVLRRKSSPTVPLRQAASPGKQSHHRIMKLCPLRLVSRMLSMRNLTFSMEL
jgi:hypothetical protein